MYRTIDAKFWTDPKVRSMSAESKLLLLYFITNSHSHPSGIYYLPTPTILFELGIKEIGYRKGIDTLSSSGIVRFDQKSSVIWVKNMMKYQGDYDKIWRSTGKHLSNLHNSLLIQAFLETYPQVKPYFTDTLSIGYPGQEISGAPDIEQEQDIEQDTPHTPLEGECDPFEQFWKVFPSYRKQGKGKARAAWKRAAKKTDPERIITAAAEYASSPVGQGQYVKGPEPWLNGECWDDDRNAWQRGEQNGQAVPSKLAQDKAAIKERFLRGEM